VPKKRGVFYMPHYETVDLSKQHIDNLIITGSSPADQGNFLELMDDLSVEGADRIAFPDPFDSVADGTLLPAIKKLNELHGFTKVHILETLAGSESKSSVEHAKLRKMAREAIGNALGGVRILEHIIQEEEPAIDIEELAITCSDHRFQEAFDATISTHSTGRVARIVHPGPSLYIANQVLLKPIGDTVDRYGITTVHIDCGAGGGLEAHGGDPETEAKAHFRHSRYAETILSNEMPNLNVTSHVVGVGEEFRPPHIQDPAEVAKNPSDKHHN
jgi:hypothetical protein